MLDLLLIRADKGGKPELVYESQKKRFKSTEIVDKSIELDKKWKELRGKADTAKMNQNNIEKQIKEKKKASKGQDPCTELIAEKDKLQKEAEELDKQAKIKNNSISELKDKVDSLSAYNKYGFEINSSCIFSLYLMLSSSGVSV